VNHSYFVFLSGVGSWGKKGRDRGELNAGGEERGGKGKREGGEHPTTKTSTRRQLINQKNKTSTRRPPNPNRKT